MELGLNGNHYISSQCKVTSEGLSFDFLYIGTNSKKYNAENHLALKEIRVWKAALSQATIISQMYKQIRNSENGLQLAFYYPIDEITLYEMKDKSFEGEYQSSRLWERTIVSDTPENLSPPEIIYSRELDIEPIIICDGNSRYDILTGRCQRDFDDPTLGLEQSTNTFVLPLSKYIFTPEWTFGFWVYIESVIGSGTSIFTQACSTATAGTLSLTKVGTDE